MAKPHSVPDTISRADYLKAAQPLLDLLGLSAYETFCDIYITQDEITLYAVARREGDDSDIPAGIAVADPPQEFAELAYRIGVKVVD